VRPCNERTTRAFIGVDVGTGSARAGVFDATGVLLASAKRPITMWREAGDVVEQSGEQIWQAVSESVREAVAASGVVAARIAGIGFDATCSLVAVPAMARRSR
jgi:D-ribulokinase